MNQVSSQVLFVELIEVDVSEILIGDFLGKHVIDRHQDLVRYRHDCPLVSSPGLETIKFVPQVSSLGLRRRLGGLYQGRLQIDITLGNTAALAFASRFIVARTNSRPRS